MAVVKTTNIYSKQLYQVKLNVRTVELKKRQIYLFQHRVIAV